MIRKTLVVLEANIDDMSAELLAGLIPVCLAAGALDAWLTPILMKKGRPAHMLSALAEPGLADAVEGAIFLNSTTLGVRRFEVTRSEAERALVAVATRWGEVAVKVASLNGAVVNASPEFADCEKLALAHSVPVKEVYAEALCAFRRGDGEKGGKGGEGPRG